MKYGMLEVTNITTEHLLRPSTHNTFEVRHPDLREPLIVEVPAWATNTETRAVILNALDHRLRTQPIEHHSGCASSRNRPCTCPYLAQWDSAGEQCVRAYDQYAAKIHGPGILVMPDDMVADALQHLDLDHPNTPIIISQSEYDHHKEH